MNVRVLHVKERQIKMPSVRSSQPTDKPRRSSPPKDAQSKSAQTKSPHLKSSSPKKEPVAYNTPYNSNVCALCGKAGHYGNQTSCHAAKHVRKGYLGYFN